MCIFQEIKIMATSLYTQQSKNVWKTWLYMSFFVLLFATVGFALAFYYQNVNIFYIAIVFSLVINLFSFWYSDKIALHMAGAREITKNEYPDFWNIAENLSITAGLPMPKLYVVDDPIPNAFATGRDKHHSAIAATTGILSMLNKTELEGVVAHEMSHIGNRDILLSTIVVIMVSAISFLSQIFFNSRLFGDGRDRDNNGGLMLVLSIFAIILAPIAATIIQLAISRKREFLADASGAILTRYPEGLASALQKISQFHQPLIHANNATAHMYIINPMGLNGDLNEDEEEKVSWFTKIFMTHPPVKERVRALLGEK
jgi:heat shock protein HtpX